MKPIRVEKESNKTKILILILSEVPVRLEGKPEMQSCDAKPELLAPAGDLEKLKYAFAFGADAVYIGGTSFGLRSFAGNFNAAEMREAVAIAHTCKGKVFVTVNIFAHEQDFDELRDYLRSLAEIGVDAAIVSDPGVIALAREIVPELPLHLSTQANNTNSFAASFWLKQGLERVTLARELTREELKRIRERVQGELELFVHGAMCMSYSGRCLLSNYLSGRDANRGECTQPCRWGYSLVEEKRPGQYFPVQEDQRGSYIFNAHDLCLLPHLPLLKELRMDSWKIEGRMKSIHYVASTVKVYREAIDTLWEEGEAAFQSKLPLWLEEMDKVSHRDYSTGFFFGKPGPKAHNIEVSNYIREYDFIGVLDGMRIGEVQIETNPVNVDPETKKNLIWIEQRNRFKRGDRLEVLSPKGTPWTFEVTEMLDGEKNPIEVAPHAQMPVGLKVLCALPPYSILRRAK